VIRDDLLPRDFDLRRVHSATVEGLKGLVRTLARHATPEDVLLFVAVNHCGREALATADPVDPFDDVDAVVRLTPLVLDDWLRPVQGPQTLVFATCYAGIFLPLAQTRKERAVLVSCGADEVYLVQRQDCAWSAFLDELFGAWCKCSLSDAVPRT